MWVDRMLDSHCDFKLWPHPWPSPWIFMVKYWNCCISGMGGSTHSEWKGMWVGYDVGCTMGLTLGHGAWQIDRPSNRSMWNSYSFQPVAQWMGYSFTDLGLRGVVVLWTACLNSPPLTGAEFILNFDSAHVLFLCFAADTLTPHECHGVSGNATVCSKAYSDSKDNITSSALLARCYGMRAWPMDSRFPSERASNTESVCHDVIMPTSFIRRARNIWLPMFRNFLHFSPRALNILMNLLPFGTNQNRWNSVGKSHEWPQLSKKW